MKHDSRSLKSVVTAMLLAAALSACATPPAADKPGLTKGAASDHSSVSELLHQADKALAAGDYEDARRRFSRAAAIAPNSPDAKIGLAETYLAGGDAATAKRLFTELIDHPSLAPRARQGHGLALFLTGQHKAAAGEMEAAIALSPDLWRAWNALGQIHDAAQRWDQAAAAYRQALAIVPDSGVVRNNLGFSHLMQGHHDKAADLFAEALRRDPSLVTAANNLRLALAWQGRYMEALAGVSGAEMPAMLNNVGYVAMLRGDYSAAKAYFSRSLESSPSYHRIAGQNLLRLKALMNNGPGNGSTEKES